ncbi:MAG: DUF3034 family protein [Thermoguttaceae bacterium]
MKCSKWKYFVAIAISLLALSSIALANEYTAYAQSDDKAGQSNDAAGPETDPAEPPPLPFFTIEGVGGGAITPMAYPVSPHPVGSFWGKPAAALSFVNMGKKNLDSIGVIETINGRVEFGYGGDRLGLGTLPQDIRTATADLGLGPGGHGIDINHSDLWLQNFNVRYVLVKEDTCLGGIALPAITAGAHFKYNDGIADINARLGGLLNTIGYRRPNGTDFTLTATKTFKDVFGHPLIVTAGMRESEAINLGFLGFTDSYLITFEGNIAYLIFPKALVAYEFRQKSSPIGEIPGLVGDEDSWHTVEAGFILNNNSTFVAGYGHFGTLANTEENGVWFLQLRYEF